MPCNVENSHYILWSNNHKSINEMKKRVNVLQGSRIENQQKFIRPKKSDWNLWLSLRVILISQWLVHCKNAQWIWFIRWINFHLILSTPLYQKHCDIKCACRYIAFGINQNMVNLWTNNFWRILYTTLSFTSHRFSWKIAFNERFQWNIFFFYLCQTFSVHHWGTNILIRQRVEWNFHFE